MTSEATKPTRSPSTGSPPPTRSPAPLSGPLPLSLWGIDLTFPVVIDSTTMSGWRSCRRKGLLEFFLRRGPRGSNPHLTAGSAYAKGHETFRKLFWGQGLSKGDALIEGLRALTLAYGPHSNDPPEGAKTSLAAKTWANVLRTFLWYYEEYPPETDFLVPHFLEGSSEPAVELSFAIPIPINNPQTGDPILVGGKLDALMEYQGKELLGFDDKTTYSMGATWAKQWRLRSQFTCYTWAGLEYGHPLKGFFVRGAAIQARESKFCPVLLRRSARQIHEWYENFLLDVAEMVNEWENLTNFLASDKPRPDFPIFRKNLDGACSSYGECVFLSVCEQDNPTTRLGADFEERTWSPIELEKQ